ncbi:MAG: adenosylmethionine--8-amino-7-oxononanoate transaminase [Acidimicrobiia bacterium]|nr:adenosylmethionine--8-amino-7-oxononanoate transaminase [Acidimicrobiia bacterium]
MQHRAHTTDLVARDKAVLWHPFTQMQDWIGDVPGPPLCIVSGEGNWLVDTTGKRYLDAVSSLWCNTHGHRHPVIDAAVRAQLDRIAHTTLLGLTHPAAVEAAEAILEVAPPGLARVFFSENGAAAVEVALKMALRYWQLRGETDRTLFVSLEDAYHGDTIGAVSVGGIDVFHAAFGPLLFPSVQAPTARRRPGGGVPGRDDLVAGMERVLEANADRVAAVIIEPVVQGAAGIQCFPDGYVRGVRDLCDAYGTLLVCDEVATGFGRTGEMFAVNHDGVTPDVLVLGKGMTGGYLPLSATVATEDIHDMFLGATQEGRHLFHGHTYSGNPLAAAACVATMEVFEKEATLAQMRPRVEALRGAMREIEMLPGVVDVRGRGYMIGIELEPGMGRDPLPARTVCQRVRDAGVVLRNLGDVVVWMPPLSITDSEVDLLTTATATAIRSLGS